MRNFRGPHGKYTPTTEAVFQFLKNDEHRIHYGLAVDFVNWETLDMIKLYRQFYQYKQLMEFVSAVPDDRIQIQGKGYRVIFDDYLGLKTSFHYDLILLQLPKRKELAYLEKAYNMQQYGGILICTLSNEQVSSTVEQWAAVHKAKIEYPEYGVAVIMLYLPASHPPSLILEHLQKNIWYDSKKSGTEQLAESDVFAAIALQFEHEVEAGIRLIHEVDCLLPGFSKSLEKQEYGNSPIMDLVVNHTDTSITINEFIRCVRYKYWEALFQLRKFTDFFTVKLQEEYRKQVKQLVNCDFNLYHIMPIYRSMVASMNDSIEETILALFNEFSQKHTWCEDCKKNTLHYDGWKTNKAWYIGEKVIIPLNCNTYYNGVFDVINAIDKLTDIERVFNFLDNGNSMNEIDLRETLDSASQKNQQKNIELKYFSVTLYKKGTCHIRFHDLDLLKKFNIFGSQKKGWLPPSYGKKHYDAMSREEQAVVDAFEGREAYEKVMARKDYYLQRTAMPLLAENFGVSASD